MADDHNTSLAGEGTAPSAASTPSILDALDDDSFAGTPNASAEANGEADAEPVEIEPAPSAEEEPSPFDEEPGGEEEPAGDAAEPEPSSDEREEAAHGNKVLISRDGKTKRTVAELWAADERVREIEQRVIPAVHAERARIEQERQHIAAQQQQLQPLFAQFASLIQERVPEAASDELWENDPIAAQLQDRARGKALEKLQGLQRAQAEHQQRLEAEASERQRAFLSQQQQLLVRALPELTDPGKAKAFTEAFHEVGAAVGFSPQELGSVFDHRLFMLAKLAHKGIVAEREALKSRQTDQAKRAIAQAKVADAPPVVKPAARQSAGVREATTTRGLMTKLQQTGSPRVAEDILSRFA